MTKRRILGCILMAVPLLAIASLPLILGRDPWWIGYAVLLGILGTALFFAGWALVLMD